MPAGDDQEPGLAEDGGRLRIVILNYNQPAETAETARGAIGQDYAPTDVVVVDNGSSPESYWTLRQLLPSETVLVRSDENLGFAGGMNLGARPMAGLEDPEYVLLMNNDARFGTASDAGVLVRTLAQKPEYLAASPLVRDVRHRVLPEAAEQVRRITNYTDTLIGGSWLLRRLPGGRSRFLRATYADQRPYALGKTYEVETVNGCCFLVRWKFLASVGFLDERTFLYFEELLLGWTIRRHGGMCALATAVTVDHVGGLTAEQLGGLANPKLYRALVRSELVYVRFYLGCGLLRSGLTVIVRVVDYVTKWVLVKARSAVARSMG